MPATFGTTITSLAYVPKGSPGFSKESLMANEVTAVTVYEVDDQGDPAPATRAEFLKVTTPSGMYFEPQTGDFIIPALGFGLYVVQGFHTPPPPR